MSLEMYQLRIVHLEQQQASGRNFLQERQPPLANDGKTVVT
jgi:hypothetical protein